MIRSRLVIKSGTYITGARFQRKYAAVVNGIGAEIARDYTPQAQQAFTDPGPVSYPIEWTSERQRIAVIIKLKREGNLPYKRTGKVEKAWRLTWSGEGVGGRLTLLNNTPYAKYVYGGFRPGNSLQQRFHRRTGWVNAIEQRDRLFVSLRSEIERRYNEALSSFGWIDTGR